MKSDPAASLGQGAIGEEGPLLVTVRDLGLETVARLGWEIFNQDVLAAQATDILIENTPDPSALPLRGWVFERLGEDDSVVTFVGESDESELPFGIFEVRFNLFNRPKSIKLDNTPLTEAQLTRYRAIDNARRAMTFFCSDRYNYVILDDIDGDGFLVYLLAATIQPNVVMMGGHYRMTLSADGQKVELIERLSRDCMELGTQSDGDRRIEALALGHVVSNQPLETHVYISLLHGLPISLVTPDSKIWMIDGGSISELTL